MNKRVCITGRYPHASGCLGGTEQAAYLLAQGLARYTDWNVEVVTLGATRFAPAEIPGVRVRVVRRLPVPGTVTFFLDVVRLRGAVRRAHPSVVHAQGQDAYALSGLGVDAARVVTVHGLLHKEARLMTFPKRITTGVLNTQAERRVLRHYQHIISISPYITEALGKNGHYHYHDIENAVAERYFELKRGPSNQTLLHVGTLTRRKGILELIEGVRLARQSNPHLRLKLLGQAPEPDYAVAIQRAIEKSGMRSAVAVLGHVADDMVYTEYSSCSALVLASREETAPISIAQALAAGVPVLASRVGGIPRMIEHGRTGLLFEPANPQSIAQALRDHLAHPARALSMSAVARAEARRRYRIESVASRTAAVYISLLQAPIAT